MKTIPIEDAVKMIPDGATLMVGGFMGVGTPERIIDELVRQGKKGLTIIANDTAIPGRGVCLARSPKCSCNTKNKRSGGMPMMTTAGSGQSAGKPVQSPCPLYPG